jgi:hypothetical protein
MKSQMTLRQLFGVALVFGALWIAVEQPVHDDKIIKALALTSLLWIVIEGVVASFRPWSMRTTIGVAITAAVLSVTTLVIGAGAAALIPLAVTVHQSSLVAWALYPSRGEPRGALRERLKKPALRRHEPPPKIDDDPFRSPPQPPPIAVRQASTTPATVPIERDEKAPTPKLLD